MAEEEDDADAVGDDDEGGGDSGKASGGGGKKKIIIIIALAFLVIVGGVAGAYFMGLLDPVIEMIVGPEDAAEGEEGGEEGEECEEGEEGDCASGRAVFYDLQELLVNLNTGGRKSSFLKIRISLELASARDKAKMDTIMPRVIDNFQTYLRELRLDDLKGSAGMYRLREELLVRVNAAAAPAKIKDVLFKEMLVQ
ncbi:MAG: flagellar basal body-associated FliL family protein [Alphaproteobacteria bacterium]|nr:flagellar basal body-associated FliL family protein [Alphaproteobacteria bacterium]